MTTAYEQYCACTTLEELEEVKPLLEAERDSAQLMYDEYKTIALDYAAKADEYKQMAAALRDTIYNVPQLIKEKGYEISFPEG